MSNTVASYSVSHYVWYLGGRCENFCRSHNFNVSPRQASINMGVSRCLRRLSKGEDGAVAILTAACVLLAGIVSVRRAAAFAQRTNRVLRGRVVHLHATRAHARLKVAWVVLSLEEPCIAPRNSRVAVQLAAGIARWQLHEAAAVGCKGVTELFEVRDLQRRHHVLQHEHRVDKVEAAAAQSAEQIGRRLHKGQLGRRVASSFPPLPRRRAKM